MNVRVRPNDIVCEPIVPVNDIIFFDGFNG